MTKRQWVHPGVKPMREPGTPRRVKTATPAAAPGKPPADRLRPASRGKGPSMKILAIDIGGTNVKILVKGARERRRVPSGRDMTPKDMAAAVKALADGWEYDAVSVGYPGLVVDGRVAAEPRNLARGWTE